MGTSTFRPGVSGTHQRLLDAAARVFAQNGLEGATTREIAREAGVNEVTLFRHFQSKENLVTAVLQRTFAPPDNPDLSKVNPPRETGDFLAGLQRYAREYQELLQRNILLIRTLIGEIHRHGGHEKQVLTGIFMPLKTGLMTMIDEARTHGIVRAEIDPKIAADLFGAMVFMEVLRRTSPFAPEYPMEVYLESAVDVFARGIEQQP